MWGKAEVYGMQQKDQSMWLYGSCCQQQARKAIATYAPPAGKS